MTEAKARARRQAATERGRAGGFYAELLTAEERALLDQPVSLDDELDLLRSCVRELARRMRRRRSSAGDAKLLQSLVQAVRAIAALERVQIMARRGRGELSAEIEQAVTALDPYQQL